MATYTVHEPSYPASDRLDRADDLVFVKDGFSWLTAVFPPLGFAGQSLWVPIGLYLAVVAILIALLDAMSVSQMWISLLVTALNVYLGFELATIKRWSLDRDGWRMLGTVAGKTLAECERRFLETWLPAQPAVVTHAGGADNLRRSGAAGLWSQRLRIWPFERFN